MAHPNTVKGPVMSSICLILKKCCLASLSSFNCHCKTKRYSLAEHSTPRKRKKLDMNLLHITDQTAKHGK